MAQTYEGFTQNLKFENENSEMDIEGTVIKVELKPLLTQIKKQNVGLENANQKEHNWPHFPTCLCGLMNKTLG